MQIGFVIAWVVALLLIGGLLALLAQTLAGTNPPTPAGKRAAEPALSKDTLLFYHEEDSVRSTADGRLIVHIPGLAWDAGWHDDLLRLEVAERPLSSITLGSELQGAVPLAVYDLAAYRMTEMGTDVPIDRFPEPIDVILTHNRTSSDLRVVIHSGDRWNLSPAALASPRQFEQVDLAAGRDWAAAAIVHVRPIALVQVPKGTAAQAGR